MDPDGVVVNYTWRLDGATVHAGASPTYDLDLSELALGSHTIALIVTDDAGCTDQDTATLEVTNAAPVARDDTAVTDEDQPVAINVTANDGDPDGSVDAASVTVVDAPSWGSVSIDSGGGATYTPVLNFHGTDAFTYTAKDDDGQLSNEATVSITVRDVNDPPVAVQDEVGGQQDTSIEIDVVENDRDLDGSLDRSTVAVVTHPAHGSVTVTAPGIALYTPEAHYVGDDVFTYTVCDDDGALSNEAAVIIHIPAPAVENYFIYAPLVVHGG
jgi:hypothetical protein